MVPLKSKIVGGGVNLGDSKDFAIDLKPGSYLYSCPLNLADDVATSRSAVRWLLKDLGNPDVFQAGTAARHYV